jgi:copper oxidase (laccase) domain-containing protein
MADELNILGLPVIGRNLDLWEANRRQLVQSGVGTERIFIMGNCTLCGEGFHSYRKSGTAERNLALGML